MRLPLRSGTCARPPGKHGAGRKSSVARCVNFCRNIAPYEEIIQKPEGALSSLKKIGVTKTVTVTYVPGYLKRIVTRRVKYLNPETEKIVIAALSPWLIPKGIIAVAPGFPRGPRTDPDVRANASGSSLGSRSHA